MAPSLLRAVQLEAILSFDLVAVEKRPGLAHWMEEVLSQCAKAEKDFSADPVHDLRTSLRRCRSVADGIRVFDRDTSWRKMRRAGKQLFSSLGALRDVHVMMEWVGKLAPEEDPAGRNLLQFLACQELALKKTAAIALQNFDRRQWKTWAGQLPGRAARISPDARVFAQLALERWSEAHALHLRALRNRTNVAFHDLRIGIKRFRYTLENFLPGLYERWSADLKEVQDILGEIHDLDVLWETALKIKGFSDPAERREWRTRLQQMRQERLEAYRAKMVGRSSLWPVWRAALPSHEEFRALGFERLRIWASFLDPEIVHTEHVSRLALELYDGLPLDGILPNTRRKAYRWVLQAAAFLHNVGLSKTSQGYHKLSVRLMRKLPPPLGWSIGELRIAALVARYHRGALPRETQKRFHTLSPSQQRVVQFLGGILRLACACDWQHDSKIRRVYVEPFGPVLTIRAEGYVEATALSQHLAAARHLLELSYHRPVFVLPLEEKIRVQAA